MAVFLRGLERSQLRRFFFWQIIDGKIWFFVVIHWVRWLFERCDVAA